MFLKPMNLKKTPFFERHIENNGRMVDFSGWALPVEYKSLLQEAKAVRNSCGLFDASHMGEIIVKGQKAFDFVQRLTPNDIGLIDVFGMQYNVFLNPEGGIIDDLMVYRLEQDILCVVNASNKGKVLNWLNSQNEEDVEILDISDNIALISLQGPNSCEVSEKVFGKDISNLKYMHFLKKEFKDQEIIISRSGYTGEDGFEIYADWQKACCWWDCLVEEGREFGLTLCGLGSRDVLRIETGYSLYGHEIDDSTNPYEASLGWIVKMNKNFIAKENVLRFKKNILKRKKIGFIMKDRSFPRQGYKIYSDGREVGEVCSGAYSPNINKSIGMAYVRYDLAAIGTIIDVEIRNKFYKAEISELPFIKAKIKKQVSIDI